MDQSVNGNPACMSLTAKTAKLMKVNDFKKQLMNVCNLWSLM